MELGIRSWLASNPPPLQGGAVINTKKGEIGLSYLVARRRFGKPWDKYEISLRDSYRKDGKVKKKEKYLMTYYLVGGTNNSGEPIKYNYQYKNIPPTHAHYFIEDTGLMDKIIEKVKCSEIKRKDKAVKIEKRKSELLNFWLDKINKISSVICEDKLKCKEFYSYVIRHSSLHHYMKYSEDYYYVNESSIIDHIKQCYQLYIENQKTRRD